MQTRGEGGQKSHYFVTSHVNSPLVPFSVRVVERARARAHVSAKFASLSSVLLLQDEADDGRDEFGQIQRLDTLESNH